MLSTERNMTSPINIDFICTSSDNNWQTTRTNRFLYLMLSTSYIDLKKITSDSERLRELIYKVITRVNHKENRDVSISDDAMTILLSHTWPGNILEVFQVIENACLKCSSEKITENDIPIRFNDRVNHKGMEEVKQAEINAIVNSWKKNNGKLSLVSIDLGLSRTTLWRKMKKLNLDKNNLVPN
ncbi:helix-turn-helix domain-containing protein, partial [Pseudomonadota bacterium]